MGKMRSMPNSLAVFTNVAAGQPVLGPANVIGIATALFGLRTRFVTPPEPSFGSVMSIEQGLLKSSQKNEPVV